MIVVMAGDGRVNSSKFKAQFHEKPHMVPREQVEELTGVQRAVYVRLELMVHGTYIAPILINMFNPHPYYFTSHEPFFLDPILSITPSSSNSFINICTVLLDLSIISDNSTCVNDGFSLRSSNIYSRSVIRLFCALFCALS